MSNQTSLASIAPDRRIAGVLFRWGCLSVYTACCLLWWARKSWSPEWDSAIYILAGRSLAQGGGYSYLQHPFFLRPPGFSWLLSFLVGGGETPFFLLNRLVMFFAAASVVLVYLAFRREGRWTALSVALLSGTCSLFARHFNLVLSDFPFMALLFASIALCERAEEERPGWWGWACGAGLCVAGAIYMRSAGLVLVPAMLLGIVFTRRDSLRWRVLLPAAIALALSVPWWLHSAAARKSAERPSEQLLLFDYATAMGHVDPGDPSSAWIGLEGWLARIQQNGVALCRDLSEAVFLPDRPWATALLLGVLLAGAACKVKSSFGVPERFALLYSLLVLTYFAYDTRLVLPLVPFLYRWILETIRWIGLRLLSSVGRASQRVLLHGAVTGALLLPNVLTLPSIVQHEERMVETPAQGGVWNELTDVADWIRENTPRDAVLLCNQAPVLSLLTDRRAFTYRFLRAPDPLSRYGVDYVVFDADPPPGLESEVSTRARKCQLIPGARQGRMILICEIARP